MIQSRSLWFCRFSSFSFGSRLYSGCSTFKMADAGFDLRKSVVENLKGHPKAHDKYIPYGTAGFRTKAELLDHVMFRVGIVAALRAKLLDAYMGVMITASHNPEPDNGAKIVDPKGDMLVPEWEVLATEIANCGDDELPEAVAKVAESFSINLQKPGRVYVGRDTRNTSLTLFKAVADGAAAANGEVLDLGVVSTPILHYVVATKNEGNGDASQQGYFKKLTSGVQNIFSDKQAKLRYIAKIKIDGANGVGAQATKELQSELKPFIDIELVNDGSSGQLNHQCGADFVKVQQTHPEGFSPEDNVRGVSLDGDADRVIYFYFDSKKQFRMLDGDKIATLFAEHLADLVKQCGLDLSIGLVQSAYANGSSTSYIQEKLGIPISCTPTGVKYLHHAALKYDIGVYFEANGHGTTVFSNKAIAAIKESASSGNNAGVQLLGFLQVINSTVGDAISDALAVEAILYSKDWTVEDWDSKYTDLPNRQLKVLVRDRNTITTTDAERVAVTPSGLQDAINQTVATYTKGRSFVRPSGTEDVVRVYAEADTQEAADGLAAAVAKLVHSMCGGVGDPPK